MQANVYITLHRYLSKCCIDAAYSPKQGSCGNSARNLPSMNTITITYMFINSGVQTFREPFAALSRSFATAAKTYIHMCRCHSDTKSLAWVLERLPYIYICIHNNIYIDIDTYMFFQCYQANPFFSAMISTWLVISTPERRRKPGMEPAFESVERFGEDTEYILIWLVVWPLWKIWKSIGMISNPIYGKKEMFQTTNQSYIETILYLVYI